MNEKIARLSLCLKGTRQNRFNITRLFENTNSYYASLKNKRKRAIKENSIFQIDSSNYLNSTGNNLNLEIRMEFKSIKDTVESVCKINSNRAVKTIPV